MKCIYLSTVLKYTFWVSVLYLSIIFFWELVTSLHLKDKYCTFHSTTFLSRSSSRKSLLCSSFENQWIRKSGDRQPINNHSDMADGSRVEKFNDFPAFFEHWSVGKMTEDGGSSARCARPWPYLENTFQFSGNAKDSFRLKCLLCSPKTNHITTFKNSPSNLQKHMVNFSFRVKAWNDLRFRVSEWSMVSQMIFTLP